MHRGAVGGHLAAGPGALPQEVPELPEDGGPAEFTAGLIDEGVRATHVLPQMELQEVSPTRFDLLVRW
ncbi:hypothetical protein HPC49_28490 [Pyxidicoccus fallax]|uniref:hypothetical protein n=1 Tax=Pyxidicoccus fallax TaxID=394095 RepID=UPI0014947F8C|nr:hypothetical protein [Pyxidicoccus fallax]NPC82144.1 hypothetical protein [Pyxidicoccus fallax]